ncbi:MAG: endonuclease III [Deltaproteobacteria bacterium]|nr:MAG: endonuclease III [Deltaproteobacteria bacterium]
MNSVDNQRKPDPSCDAAGHVRRELALSTLARLERAYPEATCALCHDSPWQLLVATILSAQCTDVRVNLVTPALFARFPDPRGLAAASPAELEALIRSTGFFRNKAAHLIGCAQALVARHGGAVPASLAELVALPGVGRKTANVVLGNAFGVPGMVVDTHVGRVARRLGWARAAQPEAVERELCALLPEEKWTQTSHVLIWHGRACCRAQTAHCSHCPVREVCPRLGVGRAR